MLLPAIKCPSNKVSLICDVLFTAKEIVLLRDLGFGIVKTRRVIRHFEQRIWGLIVLDTSSTTSIMNI